VVMSHVLSKEKREQVIALGQLGWSLRRNEHIIRLRVVPGAAFAESGKSSERKSATLPNGISAASLAVRYLSSGVTGS
jgi:hypothetical protein